MSRHHVVGRLLGQGMLAGIVAALVAFSFAHLFGEPQVDLAIAFERARDAAAGMAPEPELVSRTVQSSLGLLTAALMYGAAYGGLFALAFAFAFGRMVTMSPRMLSLVLAGMGFVTFVLIPDLKYPPNPPAVGNPETIGVRTADYFGLMVLSLCCVAVAVLIGQRLKQALGPWNATLVGCATFIGIFALVQWPLPSFNEVPDGFPAIVLWRFREAAIGMQLVLWGMLGLTFGALANRSLTGR